MLHKIGQAAAMSLALMSMGGDQSSPLVSMVSADDTEEFAGMSKEEKKKARNAKAKKEKADYDAELGKLFKAVVAQPKKTDGTNTAMLFRICL